MAYVYRHIRLDKNVPFYIGIGSDEGGSYKRAYTKFHRSTYWERIAEKGGYEVEIILDNVSWEDAAKKEIEFIALYKRSNDGGTLCNKTLGGDGSLGMESPFKGRKWSEETRVKLANRKHPIGDKHHRYGTKQNKEHIQKMVAARNGIAWNSGKKMSDEYKKNMREVGERLYGHCIFQYTENLELVKEYKSIKGAAREVGGCDTGIRIAIKTSKPYFGFIWSKTKITSKY